MDKFNLNGNILDFLKKLGLNINETTGGKYYPGLDSAKFTLNENLQYSINNYCYKITFMNPHVFLNTVKMVESSLHYKLFN